MAGRIPERPTPQSFINLDQRLTRRELFKRVTVAGLSLPVIELTLAACGGDNNSNRDRTPTTSSGPFPTDTPATSTHQATEVPTMKIVTRTPVTEPTPTQRTIATETSTSTETAIYPTKPPTEIRTDTDDFPLIKPVEFNGEPPVVHLQNPYDNDNNLGVGADPVILETDKPVVSVTKVENPGEDELRAYSWDYKIGKAGDPNAEWLVINPEEDKKTGFIVLIEPNTRVLLDPQDKIYALRQEDEEAAEREVESRRNDLKRLGMETIIFVRAGNEGYEYEKIDSDGMYVESSAWPVKTD